MGVIKAKKMIKRTANPIFNKIEHKPLRRQLRGTLTEPEKRLWQILRNKQMGVKFCRQHGIGNYIVDFYCTELKLVIEVDGDSHFSDDSQAYDKARAHFMLTLGIVTIRVKNNEVMENIEGVYQFLKQQIDLRINSDLEYRNA